MISIFRGESKVVERRRLRSVVLEDVGVNLRVVGFFVGWRRVEEESIEKGFLVWSLMVGMVL